jgi:hypothetical protein
MHFLVGLLAAEMLAGKRLLSLFDGSRLRGHAVRHSSPGRLRLEAPELKSRPGGPGPVLEALEAVEGVAATQYTDLTGSLLLTFSPEVVSTEEVLERLDALTAPNEGEKPAEDDSPALLDRLAEVARTANEAVRSASQGAADLELLLPIAIGAVGLIKVLRQRPLELPSGWILLWWSYTSLSALHHRQSQESTP